MRTGGFRTQRAPERTLLTGEEVPNVWNLRLGDAARVVAVANV